jgi:DNA-binding NarL/FixJ family response regulator
MESVRTVIASRWPLLRLSLETALAREPRIRVVGAAVGWAGTMDLVRRHDPDAAVVACLASGRRETILALRKLERRLDCRVVVVGPSLPPAPVWWMLIAGISGYVTLDQPPSDLVRAVMAAANGGALFSAQVDSLATALNWGKRPDWASLSNRELDVARLVARGLSDRDAGVIIGVTEHTVQKHVGRSMRKMGCDDRAEFVARLFASGVLAAEDLLVEDPATLVEGEITAA